MTLDLFRHYLFSPRAGALIRVIAWVCMVGVALGVLSLVLVMCIMAGFNESIQSKLLAAEPHVVVQGSQQLESPVKTALKGSFKFEMEPYEVQDVIVRNLDGLFTGAVAKGVTSEGLKSLMQRLHKLYATDREAGGEEPETKTLRDNEVLMGSDLAHSLGVFEGDQILLIPPESLLLPPGEMPPQERMIVKTLITTKLAEIDSKMIYYPLGRSFKHFKDSASLEKGYELRLASPLDYKKVQDQLKGAGIDSESWVDRNSALFFALRMEKLAMMTPLALSALIASFSIITVLSLLLTQKRQDMGVLMAMGLSPRKVSWIFMSVGLLLSGLGMGAGLVTGLLLSLFLQYYPVEFLPEIYYDRFIPARVDPLFIVCVVLGCILVALIGSFLPVSPIRRMTAAEALRKH